MYDFHDSVCPYDSEILHSFSEALKDAYSRDKGIHQILDAAFSLASVRNTEEFCFIEQRCSYLVYTRSQAIEDIGFTRVCIKDVIKDAGQVTTFTRHWACLFH